LEGLPEREIAKRVKAVSGVTRARTVARRGPPPEETESSSEDEASLTSALTRILQIEREIQTQTRPQVPPETQVRPRVDVIRLPAPQLDPDREALTIHEDRLVRWEAELKKREAALVEKEKIIALFFKDDPSPLERSFAQMKGAISELEKLFIKIGEYKEENFSSCCVCYDVRMPKEELLPCGHPLCSNCKSKLERPQCPLCRKTLLL
jgi:hypothetical protein